MVSQCGLSHSLLLSSSALTSQIADRLDITRFCLYLIIVLLPSHRSAPGTLFFRDVIYPHSEPPLLLLRARLAAERAEALRASREEATATASGEAGAALIAEVSDQSTRGAVQGEGKKQQ